MAESSQASESVLSLPVATMNGDYGKDPRKPKESSAVVLGDVVGERITEQFSVLPMGNVLDLVDLAAGRAAFNHVEGSIVTASVDKAEVTSRMEPGDHVRVEARVVLTGAASLTIQINAFCERLREGEGCLPVKSVRCLVGQLTFVAIDAKTGRSFKNVPALVPNDSEESTSRAEAASVLKTQSKKLGARFAAIEAGEGPSAKDWKRTDDPFHADRTSWVPITCTTVESCKQYLPRHENFGGNVFGGDLLMLMDRAARYCGRRFFGSSRVACTALRGMNFRLPVVPTCLLFTTAQVVFVGQHSIQIEVRVSIDKRFEGKGLALSNDGCFTVVAHDEAGLILPVKTGLDFTNAGKEAWAAHLRAKERIEMCGVRDVVRDVLKRDAETTSES